MILVLICFFFLWLKSNCFWAVKPQLHNARLKMCATATQCSAFLTTPHQEFLAMNAPLRLFLQLCRKILGCIPTNILRLATYLLFSLTFTPFKKKRVKRTVRLTPSKLRGIYPSLPPSLAHHHSFSFSSPFLMTSRLLPVIKLSSSTLEA